MDNYRKVKKLGEGAHGVVHLYEYVGEPLKQEVAGESSALSALDRFLKHKRQRVMASSLASEHLHKTEKHALVAIKKIRSRDVKSGLSFEAIRELNILQELPEHRFVMPILDVFTSSVESLKGEIYLVLEYMKTDLEVILMNKEVVLQSSDVKCILKMTLEALAHCHRHFIFHRDLKPTNLLFSSDGSLRLADFGLARCFACPNREFSPQSCTLWYRAPELLFGSVSYGPSSDMWSLGCIFAQMLIRAPLFPGKNELDQLSRIASLLGDPNSENWPGVDALPNYVRFAPAKPVPLQTILPAASPDTLDLLKRMLVFNPHDRISAQDALKHPYFKNNPLPSPHEDLLQNTI